MLEQEHYEAEFLKVSNNFSRLTPILSPQIKIISNLTQILIDEQGVSTLNLPA